MRKIFNNTIALAVLVLTWGAITNLNGQTYRQQFDWMNQKEFTTTPPSMISNLGTGLKAQSQVMEALILMYKTTKDIKYLNQFVIMAKRVMDRRDDNFVNVYNNDDVSNMPYYDPGWWMWDYDDCSNAFPPTTGGPYCYPLNLSSKGWTRINEVGPEKERRGFWTHFMESGEITTPMARFFLLLEEEDHLKNIPLPTEVLSSSSPNYYGSISVSTYTNFAGWLKSKVYETLNWELNNHYNYSTQYFWAYGENGDEDDGCTAVNQQSAIGRALLLMYVVASIHGSGIDATSYYNAAKRVGTHIYESLHDPAVGSLFTLPNSKPWTAWCHMPNCHGANWEDIGHAWLEEEMIELMVTHGIPNSNATNFTTSDLEKIANGFVYVMCQDMREVKMNVYGTNANCNQACPSDYTPHPTYAFQDQYYNAAHYVFLSKYNPGVYQAISDLFSPNQSFSGNLNHFFGGVNGNTLTDLHGLAQLAAYEHLFNPITVKTNFGGYSYTGATAGDFNGDGQMEFASLNYTVSSTVLREHQINNANNVISPSIGTTLAGNFKHLASGNISLTNPGDELVSTYANFLVLFKRQSSDFITITNTTIASFNPKSVAVGEFSTLYPGKEILVNHISGGTETLLLFGYNPTSNLLVNIPMANTIGGMISKFTVGDFNGDGIDEIVVIDNNTKKLNTYSIVSGNLFQLEASSSALTLMNPNTHQGLSCGDFDGDGIDEIILYKQVNELDAAFQIYKRNLGNIEFKGEEMFQLEQLNGVMCSMKLPNYSGRDVLLSFRNFDNQISAFNMDGLCPGLDLNNQVINGSISFDNPYMSSYPNEYIIDYHVNNILTASNFTIANSGKVEMTAGKAIVLNPGFNSENGSYLYAHIEDAIGCSNSVFRQSASTLNNSTSTIKPKELKEDTRIKVYPNPSSGVFTLNTSIGSSKDIFVYDVNGKIIFESKGLVENSMQIDLSNHAEGIYILRVTDGENSLTKKIIKN
jgi:hypothetical protein